MEIALGLGGVALGAGLTWLASMYGARKEAEREHSRWLRERRLDAWQELADLGASIGIAGRGDTDQFLTMAERITASFARAAQVGPATMDEAGRALRDAMVDVLAPDLDDDQLNNATATLAERQRAYIGLVRAHLRSD